MDLDEEYEKKKFSFKYAENCRKNVDSEIHTLKMELLIQKTEINVICTTKKFEWHQHTQRRHINLKKSKFLRNTHHTPSQAYCKFQEILCEFHVLDGIFEDFRQLSSFHICEGPGHFLAALDDKLSTFYPDLSWKWKANTLNPYYENSGSGDKLLDDTYISENVENWLFGDDGSGDIFKFNTQYLESQNLTNSFNLVTADGSIFTQDAPEEQESSTLELIKKEAEIAFQLLQENGVYIFKMYSVFDEQTRAFFKDFGRFFEQISIFKPFCSKAGNSERYVICNRYSRKAIREISDDELLEMEQVFSGLQIEAIKENVRSFVENEEYASFAEKAETSRQIVERWNRGRLWKIGETRLSTTDNRYRPWNMLYGHNLVERLADLKTNENIGDVLEKLRMVDLQIFDEYPMNYEEIMEYIEGYEKVPISTSTTQIEINHSMFVDPVLVHLVNMSNRNMYRDLFGKCSKIEKSSNFCFENSINVDLLANFDDFMVVFRKIAFENIDPIILKFTISQPPLILSRLSAAIWSIFHLSFHKVEYYADYVQFSHKIENLQIMQNLYTKLDKVIKSENPAYIHDFMPLRVHGYCYNSILKFNNSQIPSIIEKLQ